MMNGYEYTGMDAILAGSFRAAIYCRLSKDDDLDGESASIANQRDCLLYTSYYYCFVSGDCERTICSNSGFSVVTYKRGATL